MAIEAAADDLERFWTNRIFSLEEDYKNIEQSYKDEIEAYKQYVDQLKDDIKWYKDQLDKITA